MVEREGGLNIRDIESAGEWERDRERDNDRECVSERERVGPCSTQYDIQNALQYYVRDYQKPLQIFIRAVKR